MTSKLVHWEIRDEIAYIRLNRPEKLNAINGEMAEEMSRIWDLFEADKTARVAILSGAGRAFCSGQDITPGALDDSVPYHSHKAYPQNGRKLFKPIVAALHGHVAGAGFSLGVRGADISIAAEGSLFTFPEPRSGVAIPPLEFQPYLPFKISLEFMMLAWRGGKPLDAERAYHFGLINGIVPEGELLDEAERYARMLLEIPPLYIRALKYGHYKATRTRIADYEQDFFDFVHPQLISENAREGLDAFLQKRPPRFR